MNPILLPQVYTMHGNFGFTVNNNRTLLGNSLRWLILKSRVQYIVLITLQPDWSQLLLANIQGSLHCKQGMLLVNTQGNLHGERKVAYRRNVIFSCGKSTTSGQ